MLPPNVGVARSAWIAPSSHGHCCVRKDVLRRVRRLAGARSALQPVGGCVTVSGAVSGIAARRRSTTTQSFPWRESHLRLSSLQIPASITTVQDPPLRPSRLSAAFNVPGSDTLPGSTSLRRTNPALSRHKPSVTSGQSWRFCFECPDSPGALCAAPVNQVLVRSYSTTVHECVNNSHCRSYRAVSMALRFRGSTSAARYSRPKRNCVGATPISSHNALLWPSHRKVSSSPVEFASFLCLSFSVQPEFSVSSRLRLTLVQTG